MLTREDFDSFRGQTVVDAEERDGVLRLRMQSGCIIAVTAVGDGELRISDETSIP